MSGREFCVLGRPVTSASAGYEPKGHRDMSAIW
jgi:hypothetical protein